MIVAHLDWPKSCVFRLSLEILPTNLRWSSQPNDTHFLDSCSVVFFNQVNRREQKRSDEALKSVKRQDVHTYADTDYATQTTRRRCKSHLHLVLFFFEYQRKHHVVVCTHTHTHTKECFDLGNEKVSHHIV